MEDAEALAIVSSGTFFLVGLLTGVWKYKQIIRSEQGVAHPYVDICHRSSLLYAFAALLLAKFVEISQLDPVLELFAAGAVLLYFAIAIFTYFIHGLLQDTDNQLRRPFRLGSLELPPAAMSVNMWMLIIAEIGGFLILFYGVLLAI